jgi:hypothetical protein
MKLSTALVGLFLAGAVTQACAETTRFAIVRNGEQIGTCVIEVNKSGAETAVKMNTDLAVKVLFVTAFRMTHTSTERWVGGRLVALKSNVDRNGTRHAVSVSETASGTRLEVDGRSSQAERDIMPGSLWNPDLLHRSQMLDTQDGEILPLAVVDHGSQQLTIKSRSVKAHHYTLKSKFTQEVWYDDQQHLVQVRMVVSDGSVIMYNLL